MAKMAAKNSAGQKRAAKSLRDRSARWHAQPERAGASFTAAARYISDGLVDVDAVTGEFGMTKTALAKLVGLSEETLQRASRVTAPKTQQRLRDMLEILTRVAPWAGGMAQAMGWYRGQGIPALGDQTAEALVRNDQADIVRAYLNGLAAGSYA